MIFRPLTPHTAKSKPHTATYSETLIQPTDYNYFYSALIVMQNKISYQYEIQFKFRACGNVLFPAQSAFLPA